MATIYNLEPRFDSRKSFYGKAKVVVDDNGDKMLYSYGTPVVKIRGSLVATLGEYALASVTTTRHTKEFLRQNGFAVGSKSEISKMYPWERF